MKSVCCVLASSILFVACSSTPPTPPAPAAPAMKQYGNLGQLMKAIPFPASNVIFAAQNEDPAKPVAETGGADRFANMYGGWERVENASIALSETANLLKVPGRMCANGKPVPENEEAYKKGIELLIEAGEVSLKAAQAKDQDKILEAAEKVTTACSTCHDPYREKDDPKDRCTPLTAAK